MKDIVDMNSFYNASEWVIVLNMRNEIKKKSKQIYKEFRDILDNDNLPLIVGNYGSSGRLVIKEDKIKYKPNQDERAEIHNHLRAYLEKNYR